MKKTKLPLHPLAAAIAIALPATVAVPAMAQPQLEEVIVTAQKREQSLQDVPVAVSAFNAEDLANAGTSTIAELQKSSPNTTLEVSRGTSSTLTAFIRGVGQQDPLWGFEPGVGIYVDDVYYARPQGAVLDVFDVERVEILRGPQGTLYGKNTIGGAVKYVSRRMEGDMNAFANVAIGSYKQNEVTVGGQVPVIEDVLYIGGAFASLNRDGYGTLYALPEDPEDKPNAFNENLNKEVITGRISAEYSPTEELFVRFSYDKTEDRSNAVGGFDLTAQTGDVYDSYATAGGAQQIVESQGASLTVEYEVNDSMTVKSITAYRDGDTNTPIDFDVTPSEDLDVYAVYEDEQISQEIQVNYAADQFNLVGGLYYFDGDAAGAFDAPLGGGAFYLTTFGNVQTESISAYADLTYDVMEGMSVYVGGRYTSDKKTAEIFNALGTSGCQVLGDCPSTYFRVDTYRLNNELEGAAGTAGGSLSETYNEFSPRIGVNYDLTDSTMVYAGYSEGFKSGGFDMRANERVNPDITEGFQPESVDSFEIGSKGEYFNNRLRLNTALFYMEYTDMQIVSPQTGDLCDNSTIPSGTCTGAPDGLADTSANAVKNIGQATLQGVEVESIFQLTETLSMNFAFGYIDSTIDEYLVSDPTGAIGDTINIADQRDIQNTPEWTGQWKLAYSNEIADFGFINSSLGLSFRDEKQIFETPSALDAEEYTLIDASVSWSSADEHWSLALHGKNLSNERYRVSGYVFPAGSVFGADGVTTAYYGAPRTFTLKAGYKFF